MADKIENSTNVSETHDDYLHNGDYGNLSWNYYYENEADSDSLYMRYIVSQIDIYMIPIVVVVGITGNMISLCVFLMTHLRKMSWSVYLAALAISDSGFLLCVLLSWSNNVGVHIYHTNVCCQIFVYLTYVCSFLSVWYVVAFTFERYLVIQYPLRRNELTTPRRARLVVISLTVVALLLYNFALWTSGVQPMYHLDAFCTILPQYYELITILTNVDAFVTFVLPFLMILFFNITIICKITRYHERKRKLPLNEQNRRVAQYRTAFVSKRLRIQGQTPSNEAFNTMRINNKGVTSLQRSSHAVTYRSYQQTNQLNRLTYMLLVVSGVFLLLNLPTHAIRFYVFVMQFTQHSVVPSNRFISWQRIFQYVNYCNFAVNFFLYSLCGRTFRSALKHMITKTVHRIRNMTLPPCLSICRKNGMGNFNDMDVMSTEKNCIS